MEDSTIDSTSVIEEKNTCISEDEEVSNETDYIQFLRSLSELQEITSKVEIDISNINPETIPENELPQLAKHLLPLVFKKNIVRVIIPDTWRHRIRKSCRRIVYEAVREVTGEHIHILGHKVRISDVLVSDRKLDKLVSASNKSLSDNIETEETIVFENIGDSNRKLSTFETQLLPKTDIEYPMTEKSNVQHISTPNPVYKQLGVTNSCYVCKKKYEYPKTMESLDTAWKQYPAMCYNCAAYNYRKRYQSTDLRRKYAVVTGGRIKIGYHVVLKLLRDGCHVIATTRFPRDAATRFQGEADFELFHDRLKIYPLDLRKIQSVYEFVSYVNTVFPHLDILINNAAQTIRRPVQFYQHLLEGEQTPYHLLPAASRSLLVDTSSPHFTSVTDNTGSQTNYTDVHVLEHEPASDSKRPRSSEATQNSGKRRKNSLLTSRKRRRTKSSATSSALCPAQRSCSNSCTTLSDYFPAGQLDADGQQLDLRRQNSWRLGLAEVPLVELVEVLAVNSVGPFLLTQHLKPALDRSPAKRRFVINVSAMEGQFGRQSKNHFHPHTNMAKAALNMLTRTSGVEFRDTGVYMTAVDTGWVTDERPYPQMKHEESKGFFLPLDCVDGAARVYDPVVIGLERDKEPLYAVFIKDYKIYSW